MTEHTFTTSLTPHITVEVCKGDLTIAAVDTPEVVITFDEDDGDIQREGETLRVQSRNDCKIVCPPDSSITLQSVSSDLSVSDLHGTLAVESVAGDVSVRGVGVMTLRSAGSDMSARNVEGDLRIESLGGDLGVRRVGGQLFAANVGGDLSARALNGGFDIAHIGGDASLESSIEAGKVYRLNADGDLTLRLPADTSARIRLKAGGEIENRVEFSDWRGDEHSGEGVLGDGEAQVELSAGGDLTLRPQRFEDDFEFNLNFELIGSQIDEKMGHFERELELKMSQLGEQIARMAEAGARDIESRLRHVDVDRIARRTERAAERMREKAERARQQAERAAERARRRATRHRHVRFGVNFPPSPAKPAAPAASEAERLMILRMLEEKKISADEAGRLLDALEG